MPYEFVGGSRHGTISSEQDLPDDGIGEWGATVRTQKGDARELYELRDGKLHHVWTFHDKPWRQAGDPCPNCRSNKTRAVAAAKQSTRVIHQLGSALGYEVDPQQICIV